MWEYALSVQQQAIARLLAQGRSNKQVAEELGISHNSVKVQVFRIKQKQQRMGVNKIELKQLFQYPSAPLDTDCQTMQTNEIIDLIKELESSKGLNLTPLQKRVVQLKAGGINIKTIADILLITTREVQASVRQAVTEIRRIQAGDDRTADGNACVLLRDHGTVNETQVLSCLSKGMSVKGAARKLGKTEPGVRAIVHRSGVSIRALKEQRRMAPRFKNNQYRPPNTAALALLWRYYAGGLTAQETMEAEIFLRSEGLIRATPAIMKNNGRFLKIFSVQKRKKIFQATPEEGVLLKNNMPGMKGNVLEYSGATRIHVNYYAKEEAELYGTAFACTYTVGKQFWPAIQTAAGSVPEATSERDSECHQPEGTACRGSRVLLQDLDTGEKLLVMQDEAGASVEGCHVLSPEAPLAKALLGRRVGDCLTLEIVKGCQVRYEVLLVENNHLL
jgi:DNA-binding NarL/FixJ family response regulator